jgi:hypothetical protein
LPSCLVNSCLFLRLVQQLNVCFVSQVCLLNSKTTQRSDAIFT